MELNRLNEIISSHAGDLNDILISAAIVLAAVILGLVLQKIMAFVLSRWQNSHTSAALQDQLKPQSWQRPLRSLLPACLLLAALPFLRFSPVLVSGVRHLLWIWIIASFTWLVLGMITVIKNVILSRYQIDEKDNLHARRVYTQLGVIERILRVVVIFIGLAVILLTFEKVRQVGISLLASAGVLGIILGFSAQKSLATLFAGIQIALTQPIRIDDVVIVENEWGWIEEITLTYVVVKIWDQRRLVVPITYFIEKPFQNWTRTTAEILGTVYLYVDYTAPVREIRQELERILEATPLWNHQVGVLQVTGAQERTLELRALMSAQDSSTAWSLRCHVREKLIEYLQREYPQCLPHLRITMEKKFSDDN